MDSLTKKDRNKKQFAIGCNTKAIVSVQCTLLPYHPLGCKLFLYSLGDWPRCLVQ